MVVFALTKKTILKIMFPHFREPIETIKAPKLPKKQKIGPPYCTLFSIEGILVLKILFIFYTV